MSGLALEFRILLQRVLAQFIVIGIRHMRRTRNQEAAKLPALAVSAEKLFTYRLVIQREGIAEQRSVCAVRHIVGIADIFFKPHRRMHDAAVVENRLIVMERFGGIPPRPEQTRQALREIIRAVGKRQIAIGRQVNACVDTELGVERAHAAIARRIHVGKIDALSHHAADIGRQILVNQPVIHALHQHDDHIFSFKQTGHFVGLHIPARIEIGINGLAVLLQLCGIGRRVRHDEMLVNIAHGVLIQAADAVNLARVIHDIVGSLERQCTAVFVLRTP